MPLLDIPEGSHVPLEILNRQETAWTERASIKIYVSFFCLSLSSVIIPLLNEDDGIAFKIASMMPEYPLVIKICSKARKTKLRV